MNTQEGSLPIESAAPLGGATSDRAAVSPLWQRMGKALEAAGEWLNPLLVKEVRQSLKSRQFSITFTLVLCLGWIWSIFGIARMGPDVAMMSTGPDMFYGYYMILSFPLILIVPYSTFRSLISEREDNTYELVAITSLRPRQIVAGKLGSAIAQMVVYFSAVAPCLAFTYLLRGIDVPTICFIMFWTFMASLAFSLTALLLATIAKEKHWQVMVSVLIIVGLFWAFVGACAICHDLLRNSRSLFNDPDFWPANLAWFTGVASTTIVFYIAAAAQLTFTAENRSTPLRIAMLGQQALLAGWLGYVAVTQFGDHRREAFAAMGAGYMVCSCMYWYFMGSLMSGEATELSPRVKRGLPKTFLGRVFFTWFNPGPGTGYLFAVSNVAAAAMLAMASVLYGMALQSPTTTGGPSMEQILVFIALSLAYVTIYLGVGGLLLRLLRRFVQVTLASSIIFNALIVLAGWGIPWVIEPYDIEHSNYTLLHITDPFWSCVATVHPRIMPGFAEALLMLVLPAAGAVLLLNLVYIIPEMQHERITAPTRVQEEDQQLAAQLHPPKPQPTNPWDE